jgi:hypothetical protein
LAVVADRQEIDSRSSERVEEEIVAVQVLAQGIGCPGP